MLALGAGAPGIVNPMERTAGVEKNFDAVYFYEQVSGIYDRDTHPFIMNPQGSYAKGFASLIAALKPASVLEIGCGTGKRFISVVHFYEENNLTLPRWSAVEPGEGMRKQIPEDIQNKMDTLYIDKDLSRFADNTYELTLSSGVLCSISTREAASIVQESYRIAKNFIMHTDTPKDRPHLHNLDFFKFFNIPGAHIVHWDTLTPYPYPGEEEHRMILKKNGPLDFADDFPLRVPQRKHEETWQEVLDKRLKS